MCYQCRKEGRIVWVKTGLTPDSRIDELMTNESITDALNKARINPMRKTYFRDAIHHILQDKDLKYAFAQACEKQHLSAEKLMKKITKNYLIKEGFLDA